MEERKMDELKFKWRKEVVSVTPSGELVTKGDLVDGGWLKETTIKTLPIFTKKEVEALKAFEERKRKPKNKLN